MGEQTQHIDVLMYHSISDAGGPTSIPRQVFSDQMNALAETGYHVADFVDLVAWRDGQRKLPDKTAIVTFDDGFLDFRDTAWPILNKLGFPATVFLPTDCMGGYENWNGANHPPRQLMSWSDIGALYKDGARFGSHSQNHANLTQLAKEGLSLQLRQSRGNLEDALGEPVDAFAAPYGAVNEGVLSAIAEYYDIAAGTRLGRTDAAVDIFDVPRLEMHYFRDIALWRKYLEGKAERYLTIRKFARNIRRAFH